MAQDKVKKAKNMAFAFDIDGVLVHGDRLIPEAKKALDILNGDNELGIKVSPELRTLLLPTLQFVNEVPDPPYFPHQWFWQAREGPLRTTLPDPQVPGFNETIYPISHSHVRARRILQHRPRCRW